MKPPICYFCNSPFYAESPDAGATGDLVRFADYAPLPAGVTGHPHGYEWFCAAHLAAARALSGRKVEEAMAQMRNAPPGSVPAAGAPWPVASNGYRHPHAGGFGRLVEAVANSRGLAGVRRALLSRLPFLTLKSDVTDVVYLTWLVPVSACAALVPPGVALWQRNGLTPFTALTYRHAHFGPALAGPLRAWFPSPLQSNWRLYLDHAPAGAAPVATVLFLKNVMNSLPYAVGTRVFSDALPTHLAGQFAHRREGEVYRTRIAPGAGSAPALESAVRPCAKGSLGPGFTAAFGSWGDAVEFLACQDAAVARAEQIDRLAFAEIDLPIDPTRVLPAVTVGDAPACSLLDALRPVEGPLCFIVPGVHFRAVSERLL